MTKTLTIFAMAASLAAKGEALSLWGFFGFDEEDGIDGLRHSYSSSGGVSSHLFEQIDGLAACPELEGLWIPKLMHTSPDSNVHSLRSKVFLQDDIARYSKKWEDASMFTRSYIYKEGQLETCEHLFHANACLSSALRLLESVSPASVSKCDEAYENTLSRWVSSKIPKGSTARDIEKKCIYNTQQCLPKHVANDLCAPDRMLDHYLNNAGRKDLRASRQRFLAECVSPEDCHAALDFDPEGDPEFPGILLLNADHEFNPFDFPVIAATSDFCDSYPERCQLNRAMFSIRGVNYYLFGLTGDSDQPGAEDMYAAIEEEFPMFAEYVSFEDVFTSLTPTEGCMPFVDPVEGDAEKAVEPPIIV